MIHFILTHNFLAGLLLSWKDHWLLRIPICYFIFSLPPHQQFPGSPPIPWMLSYLRRFQSSSDGQRSSPRNIVYKAKILGNQIRMSQKSVQPKFHHGSVCDAPFPLAYVRLRHKRPDRCLWPMWRLSLVLQYQLSSRLCLFVYKRILFTVHTCCNPCGLSRRLW